MKTIVTIILVFVSNSIFCQNATNVAKTMNIKADSVIFTTNDTLESYFINTSSSCLMVYDEVESRATELYGEPQVITMNDSTPYLEMEIQYRIPSEIGSGTHLRLNVRKNGEICIFNMYSF